MEENIAHFLFHCEHTADIRTLHALNWTLPHDEIEVVKFFESISFKDPPQALFQFLSRRKRAPCAVVDLWFAPYCKHIDTDYFPCKPTHALIIYHSFYELASTPLWSINQRIASHVFSILYFFSFSILHKVIANPTVFMYSCCFLYAAPDMATASKGIKTTTMMIFRFRSHAFPFLFPHCIVVIVH